MEERIKQYLARLGVLQQQRQEWESLHYDVQQYVLPRRGRFQNKGDTPTAVRKSTKIINATATWAMRVLGAGMQGGLTSPARPWFRLSTPDPDLNKFAAVQEWLDDVMRRMYAELARSNFYTTIHNCYIDQASFGCTCVAQEDYTLKNEQLDRALFQFARFPVGEYYLASSYDGSVDTVYRTFPLTLRAAAMRFGAERLSDTRRRALDERPDDYIDILHVYEPRKVLRPGKIDSSNWPLASVYIELGGQDNNGKPNMLEDGGYMEPSIFTARWDAFLECPYGGSPVHDVLPDIKMLQQQERSGLKGFHKSVDPPIISPTAYRGRLRLNPGDVTYGDGADAAQLKPLYEREPRLDWLEQRISRCAAHIREGLYSDLFLMYLDKPNMTATEIAERQESKLIQLGPVIERQFHELLDPTIDRTFAIMLRSGRIPPPPRELEGQELKVEYISLLAQAQKLVATRSLDAELSHVERVAALQPSVLDVFDGEQSIREYAEAVGTAPSLMRTEDEIAKIRQARARQEQEAQKRLDAAQAIEGAHKLSQTDTSGENALTELSQAMGGA